MANGLYRVNLFFAEIYRGTQSVGARVFDIAIEGTLVFDNLDIYAEVGGYTALIKSVDTQVDDGVLDIQVLHVVQNPKVSAIEVLALSGTGTNQAPTAVVSANPTSGVAPLTVVFTGSGSTDADGTVVSYAWDFGDSQSSTLADPSHTYQSAGTYTATLTVTDDGGLSDSASVVISVLSGGGPALRINAGGGSYTDSLGQVWQADQCFNTGNTFDTSTAIVGTVDDLLFQSERWDPPTAPELQCNLAMANGLYRVNLFFAELYRHH